MSGRVNVRSGYCLVGNMSGRANVYWASVLRLLSGQVTVQLGYCPVGLLSGQATVFRLTVPRATVCQGRVLGEVSIGLVNSWATVRVPLRLRILGN